MSRQLYRWKMREFEPSLQIFWFQIFWSQGFIGMYEVTTESARRMCVDLHMDIVKRQQAFVFPSL